MRAMFITEQMPQFSELQYEVAMEDEHLDAHVWSPVSCRYTNWTFRPHCKTDHRGRITAWYRCDWTATGCVIKED